MGKNICNHASRSLSFLKSMLVFAILSCIIFSCEKEDEGNKVTIDGLNYYLYPQSHEAVIDWANTWSGELDIPASVRHNGNSYVVNGIAAGAFRNCTELTKVRIPKSIDHIVHYVLDGGNGAVSPDNINPFIGCTALESIEVDKDNPIMSSVNGVLFNKDMTRLYCFPAGLRLEAYNIPESVTWIGASAFAYNNHLSTLTIPNSVTQISVGMCSNCTNLKSVKLSECINYIEAYSFEKCESLRFLDIPEKVQGFGEGIFRWTHLETIVIRGTFPEGLRDDTFYLMDAATVIYAQQSEIDKFKNVFSGTVLPIESYTDTGTILGLEIR
jgi:hypothetical protein